jgi:hypothetical protein
MHTSSIREAVLRRPFQPFILRMNDGRVFHVRHPEYVAVSRRMVVVIDPETEAGIWLEPVLIASLEFEGSTPAAQPETQTGGGA